MVTADQSAKSVLGPAPGDLSLKVRGTKRDGQVVRLHSGKCTIGADRRCTLRLRAPRVRPLHCLILRGQRGMVVRSWTPDTLLNGRRFDTAALTAGDRLTCGPIELEVLPGETSNCTVALSSVAADDASWIDEQAEQVRRARAELAGEREALAADQQLARAEIEARRAELIRDRGEYEQGQTELADHLARHGAEVERWQATCEEQEQRLLARATALEAEAARLDAERQAWQAERDRLTAELESAKLGNTATAADLQRQLDQRQEQLARQAAELSDRQSTLDRGWAELVQRQQDCEHQGVVAEGRFVDRVNHLDERQQQIEQREAELRSQLAEAESRGRTLDLRQQELAAHETELAQRQSELATVQQTLDERQRQLEAMAESLAARQREIDEAQVPSSPAGGDARADWERERAELLADVERRQAECRQQQAQLERERENLEAERAALCSERAEIYQRQLEHPRSPDAGEEALFERLRSLTAQPAADDPEPSDPGSSWIGGEADRGRGAEEAVDESADEPSDDAAGAGAQEEAEVSVKGYSVAGDDEESIEDYMARLLNRVRSGPSGPSRPARVESARPRRKTDPAPEAAVEAPPVAAVVEPAPEPEPKLTEPPKPRSAPPEAPELARMRELANYHSRAALHKHARSMSVRAPLLRWSVAATCLIMSVLAICVGGNLASTIGALVGLGVCGFWVYQAVLSTKTYLQARKESESAPQLDGETTSG